MQKVYGHTECMQTSKLCSIVEYPADRGISLRPTASATECRQNVLSITKMMTISIFEEMHQNFKTLDDSDVFKIIWRNHFYTCCLVCAHTDFTKRIE